MTGILWNTLFFLLTLGILVSVHEFGHFWVGRKLGFKVLSFSIGFGPALWRRQALDGTVYQMAAIPLGGYVKFLDEREGDVPADLMHLSFQRQSVYKRWAVVAAGPVFNFLLAVLVFSLMFMWGVTDLRAVLGPIKEGSIAHKAGLREGMTVVRVNDAAVSSWDAFGNMLLTHIGSTEPLILTVQTDQFVQTLSIPGDKIKIHDRPEQFFIDLGLQPAPLPAILGVVEAQGVAAAAGLKAGDQILSFGDHRITRWGDFTDKIRAHPNKAVTLGVRRDGQTFSVQLTPKAKSDESGKTVGFLGVGPDTSSWLVRVQYGPLDAVRRGLLETGHTISRTATGLWQLISGAISVKAISGPLSIAESAGITASIGVDWFLKFLGLLSVNLGLINLLPVPVLDGGHLLFYSAEIVRGKPLSERIQELGMRMGVSFVAVLMLLALYNDFTRYL